MIYLVFMAVIVAAFALYSYYKDVKLSLPLLILTAFPVWFVLSFRGIHVGNDTIGYVNRFIQIVNMPWSEVLDVSSKGEPGIFVLMKLISYISTNETFFLCVINAFMIFATLFFFRKNTEKPIIPFYLWVTLGGFQFALSGLRQALAMSICLFAVEFIKNKKIVWYILIVFLATLFHKSAFLFFPVYALAYFKNTKLINYFWFALGVVVAIYITQFQVAVNDFLYGDLDRSYTELETGAGGFVMIAYITIIALCFMIKVSSLTKEQGERVLYNLSMIAWLFWIGRIFTRVAERPGMYFMFMFYAMMANLVVITKDKNGVFIRILILLFPLALFIYRNLNFNYTFIFE